MLDHGHEVLDAKNDQPPFAVALYEDDGLLARASVPLRLVHPLPRVVLLAALGLQVPPGRSTDDIRRVWRPGVLLSSSSPGVAVLAQQLGEFALGPGSLLA